MCLNNVLNAGVSNSISVRATLRNLNQLEGHRDFFFFKLALSHMLCCCNTGMGLLHSLQYAVWLISRLTNSLFNVFLQHHLATCRISMFPRCNFATQKEKRIGMVAKKKKGKRN